VRLLLDTHIFLWTFGDPDRLPSVVAKAIVDPDNDVFLSAISVWEIAIKRALGRLDFPLERLDETLTETGFEVLDFTAHHAVAAGALPRHHDDPFDRALIAQAVTDGLVLASVDRNMPRYGLRLLG